MPDTERLARRRGLLAVLLAVLIWGSFTAVAAVALEAGVSYLTLSLATQVLLYLPFVPLMYAKRRKFRAATAAIRPWRGLVVFSGFASVLRDLCFIYALANAPKLQVSVLDALWPIAVVVLAGRVLPQDRRSLRRADWLLIVSAFVGASFLWLPTLTPAGIELTTEVNARWYVYAAAIAGALFAAIEVVTVRYVQRQAGLDPTLDNAIFVTQLQRGVAMLVALAAILVLQVDITELALAWPQVTFLGLGWAVATIAFSYGMIVYPSPTIASIAYLSPVTNSVLLAILFADVVLTPVVMIGICLIVLSNLYLHISRRHMHSGIAALIVVSWIGVLLSYRPVTGNSDVILNNAGILTSLFAIVVGFSLWRLGERDRALNLKISEICLELSAVFRSASKGRDAMRAQLDLLLKHVTDLLYEERDESQGGFLDRIDARFDELRAMSRLDVDRGRTLYDLEKHVRELIVLKSERLTFAELATLLISGFVSALIFIINRSDGVAGDLVAVSIAFVIVFLIFSMLAMDRAKTFWSFRKARRFFPAYSTLGLTPYLPAKAIGFGEFEMPRELSVIRSNADASGEGDEDALVEVELVPDPRWLALLPHAVAGVILLCVGLAIAQARGLIAIYI